MELLIYFIAFTNNNIFNEFKFQYGATNILKMKTIITGKIYLNSNMELLISHNCLFNFIVGNRFKFQYGATNIIII